MAAVEYGECPSIHTSRLAHFEYGIRVLEVYFFSPDLNWNVRTVRVLEHGPGACAAPPPSQRTYRQLSPRGKKQTQEPDVLADLKLHPIHPIWIKAVR